MKTKQKRIILIIIILALTSFCIFMSIRSKSNNIQLGMNINNLMTVIEKNGYEYEINGSEEDPIIFIHNISISDVTGNIYCHIQNNKISSVTFSSDTEDLNNKIDILFSYLKKEYGEPIRNEDISTGLDIDFYRYYEDDIAIAFSYPSSSNSCQQNISIVWSYKNQQ